MLVSMTGFGSCTTQGDDYVISTEIKAVNNRFLKTSIKLPEGFSGLESKIDELLHEKIARGSELRTMIEEVERIAPTVVENYRAKLTERVTKALEETSVDLDPSALIREVAIFTDRVDISEEIARFISHLSQFSNTMECEKVCGKKLDFLTQEMFRETNTIGSKANSQDVLRLVVEMKSVIERIREMVQNVE